MTQYSAIQGPSSWMSTLVIQVETIRDCEKYISNLEDN